MNLYREMEERQRARVHDYLGKYAFFAFDKGQFAEGLQKMGISEDEAPDKLTWLGAGGYMLSDRVADYVAMLKEHRNERTAAIADPETGLTFARQMFKAVLADHEYAYTCDTEDTLDALGYTLEQVEQDPVLNQALQEATRALLGE